MDAGLRLTGFLRPLAATALLFCILCMSSSTVAPAQEKLIRIYPRDEKTIQYQDPAAQTTARLPNVPPPPTVTTPYWDALPNRMGLDDAIRTTLANSNVVRVLTGITASSSGSTIYDAAITNTTIDVAKGRFDPTVNVQNTFTRQNQPEGIVDPFDPAQALILGAPVQSYDMNLGVSKINSLGGTLSLGVNVVPSRTQNPSLLAAIETQPPGLNPQTQSSIQLSYTQPLLQGAGAAANLAPIVIARLNTERSYFQFKDSLQQSVKGVIQAYWSLVFARTDVWARQRQVSQNREAFLLAKAKLETGRGNLGDVAQAETALDNSEATLITSQANLLNQEAALTAIMGLPPDGHILPLSPPSSDRREIKWQEIVNLAGQHRPDLIELQLILDADRQMLIQARNQARPQVNAVFMYQWNGLEGTMPNGSDISTFGGNFNNWNLGVNFSVPLGLRASRASLRQQELILFRDQANLNQGLLNAGHALALDLRNLAQDYDQYKAYRKARTSARTNLEFQLENYRAGRTILLNVLQAISDWGNAVSAESQSLTQYNTDLATVEQDTGTILETHGIRFFEERYRSLGPLAGLGKKRDYPEALMPSPNDAKYPQTKEPAENFFNLEDPLKPKTNSK